MYKLRCPLGVEASILDGTTFSGTTFTTTVSSQASKTSAGLYAARRASEWITSEGCLRKRTFAAFSSKLTQRAAPRVVLRARSSNDLEREPCCNNVCNVVCASALRKTKKTSLIFAAIPTEATQSEVFQFLARRPAKENEIATRYLKHDRTLSPHNIFFTRRVIDSFSRM